MVLIWVQTNGKGYNQTTNRIYAWNDLANDTKMLPQMKTTKKRISPIIF